MTSPVLDGFEPTLAHLSLQRRQQGFRCRILLGFLDFANPPWANSTPRLRYAATRSAIVSAVPIN
jgi:hypothetical protein